VNTDNRLRFEDEVHILARGFQRVYGPRAVAVAAVICAEATEPQARLVLEEVVARLYWPDQLDQPSAWRRYPAPQTAFAL
jgi:hypothetical protein